LEVRAVLAQRLYVSKADLPSALLNQIKRLAAFQNPEFTKKQRRRLSTALTPRVIACAVEFPEHVALPRGRCDDLKSLLQQYGVRLVIDDQRVDGDPLDVLFNGALTPGQSEAAERLLARETGIIVAPPGMGKTVLGVYLVAQGRRSTLVLVHRRPLLDQWKAQLALFLGLDKAAIGEIGRGKQKATGRLYRPHPRKMEVRIYDYLDAAVPMLQKMFERRLRTYRAIGHEYERPGNTAEVQPRLRTESALRLPILPEDKA
jgi:superfamily II DNA or RNA helicase